MKSLFCTSHNLFWNFVKSKPEASIEIVLSLLEKQFTIGPGGVSDGVNYETCRFAVTAEGLTAFIDSLIDIRDALDREIDLVQPLKQEAADANDQ